MSKNKNGEAGKGVRVLISDKMSPLAAEIFRENGVNVDVVTGLSPDELKEIIGKYDGIAIRSATKLTSDILEHASNLKVIGRAGIGVDNVDIPAATARGVVVMNTPFGNSVTTAEHAIAMMFALARDIPQANNSTHQGKWEKSAFMGVELFNKTLGVIGCGNIGSIVADRALGLKMDVLAYDPFLTEDRAVELGVKKVELDELLAESDFITLHVPKNDATKGIINASSIAKMIDGVRIINCARGGLIVEQDLLEALNSGKVAGAALDVFETEPARENILFGNAKVVCTPHLGASTTEAQVNVAMQVAEQISDYLIKGTVTNALNMPSVSADEAPRLKPYMKLAEQIGSFAGQIIGSAVKAVEISYQGDVSRLNTKPLTQIILSSLMRPSLSTVNIVNAPEIAKSRGISLSEKTRENCDSYYTAVVLNVETEEGIKSLKATLFGDSMPRIVEIDNVPIELKISEHMLFIKNEDRPGLIGGLGSIFAKSGQNIADFRLGRDMRGGQAICLVSVDDPIREHTLNEVKELPQVINAYRLCFDV